MMMLPGPGGSALQGPGYFLGRAGCVCRGPRGADEVLMRGLPAAFQPANRRRCREGGAQGDGR